MTDDPTIPNGFHGTARLFPMPNVVLFPGIVQGLHIFEPRYRQMTADALAADSLIAMALLKPGFEEDYDGKPPIEPVACLGRVIWHEDLPDGRYNLRLRGLARVRIIEEVPSDRLYRVASVEIIPEAVPADPGKLKELRQKLADAVLPQFDDGPALRQVQELFEGEMTLGRVCDVLAYALPLPVEMKQALLAEADVSRRAATITDALRVSAARADRKFPPEFSPN
jgi:Lon protease-like protein